MVHFLVPWPWLRWLFLIVGIYAVFWAIGCYASLVVLPHRLEPAGLRVRYGILADGLIPYATIGQVERQQRRPSRGGDGLRVFAAERAAYLAVGGKTDVSLRLDAPLALLGFLGPTAPVSAIHLAVDEPERLARDLQRRLSENAALASQGSRSTTPG